MFGAQNRPRSSQQESGAKFAEAWKKPTTLEQIKGITFHCFKGKEMEKEKENKSKDEGKGEIPLIWRIHSGGKVK